MTAKILGPVAENKLYAATCTPTVARELFFVSTYDAKDPKSNAHDKHGYQRPPTSSRFAEIGKYFAEDDNRYKITPLIVSVRLSESADIQRFLRRLEKGDIQAIREEFGDKVASIVDGQHREKGLLDANEKDSEFEPTIPCMLYFGLSFIDEANFFNTINVTQRKLPKALIETTKGDITEAGDATYAQEIRRLTFSLCREDDSVWGPVDGIEQINMTGVRDPNRQVTYEGLRRSTSNMFPKQLLERLSSIDEGLPLKLAKRYWKAVSESCAEGWNGMPDKRTVIDPDTGAEHEEKIKYRLKDLVGVASLAKLGKDIINSQIENSEAALIESHVDKLAAVDWEKSPDNPWMRSQAGFAGQKELYELLYKVVYTGEVPVGLQAAKAPEESQAA